MLSIACRTYMVCYYPHMQQTRHRRNNPDAFEVWHHPRTITIVSMHSSEAADNIVKSLI